MRSSGWRPTSCRGSSAQGEQVTGSTTARSTVWSVLLLVWGMLIETGVVIIQLRAFVMILSLQLSCHLKIVESLFSLLLKLADLAFSFSPTHSIPFCLCFFCFFVFLSVFLSLCLRLSLFLSLSLFCVSHSLPVCLSVCQSVSLSVCLSYLSLSLSLTCICAFKYYMMKR